MFGLSELQIILLTVAALLVGLTKTGFVGITLPAIALLAMSFGAKASSGIMLPMLMVGDIISVIMFGRNCNLKDLLKVLPPAVAGVALGSIVGLYTSDSVFRLILGIAIIICALLLAYKEITKKTLDFSQNMYLHVLMGVLSGFATMLGNASGPIFAIYLLALSYEKKKFIGTTAWFFFIMNWIKVPFHVFMWHTITKDTLLYTAVLIPVVAIGALAGYNIIKRINEQIFRIIIIVLTTAVAVALIVL